MSDAKLNRRGFLAGAAGLTGVALSVGAWKPVFAMEQASAAGVRDLVPAVQKVGHIALILEGKSTSPLLEAEGGAASTEVNVEESNSVFIQHRPGALKWGAISLKRGRTDAPQLNAWIRDSLEGRPEGVNGSIVGANENFKIFTRTDFFNALITEVGFPALDAASKDAAKMTIKFQPEHTRTATTGGGSLASGPPVHEKWLVSNFKLTINGMNTSFVTSVDAINIKLNFAAGNADRGPHLASIDAPNMKIRIPESHAQDFVSWHQDFVINGNNSTENEKVGSLSFLSPDLKTEFFRLDLSGLGIFALDADPLTLAGDSVRHVTAQLYCDKMIFNFKL